MGVDLSDIITSEQQRLEDFKGRRIAIDAFNTIYQFLAIIRQPNGTPLRDSRGRTTSHLSGLIYRTTSLLQLGIEPVFVFDGRPPRLKSRTVEERRSARERAKKEWIEALEEGDIQKARAKAQASSRLSEEIVDQSKKLLYYLGVPTIQAPGEGEAQASMMAMRGDVWAAASQDFDSILFGTPLLIRNLTITGKRKLPRKQVYVDVQPEMVRLDFTLQQLGITREQLVDLSILVGTDFNAGVKGIGPKSALSLIKKHRSLDRVLEEEGFEIPEYEEIREIFLHPDVITEYSLEWREADEEAVVEFLCDQFDFSERRVRSAVEKARSSMEERKQRSLDLWA